MADYTTYAVLLSDVEPEKITPSNGSSYYGKHADGYDLLICKETDPKFDSLLGILKLDKSTLPSIQEKFISADQWRQFGWADFEGDQGFPVSELDWLNSTRQEWKGTDEQYELYEQGEGESLYEWVTYGTFEEEYPELNKLVEVKSFKCIVFQSHYTGDDKAGMWGNWLGENAMHGDFDCVIFARDAAKHMRYEDYPDNFKYADKFVENAEVFAKKHGDDKAVMFGFG